MALSFTYRRLKGNMLGSVCNRCQKVITSWNPVNWPEHQRLEGKKATPTSPLLRGEGWVVNFEQVHNRHAGHVQSAKIDPKICVVASPDASSPVFVFNSDPLVGAITFESVGDYKAMRVLAAEDIERMKTEAAKPVAVAEPVVEAAVAAP